MTVDTAAPAAPAIASFSNDSGAAGDGITSDNTLAFTGTAAADSTVQVYDGATLLGTVTANGSGAWSFTTATLDRRSAQLHGQGDRCGRQRQRGLERAERDDRHRRADGAGDRLVSTDSGVAGDGITNDNTLALTGTAAANSTVQVYDGATLLGTVTANGSGAWSFTTATLADGAHSFTATATDAAGNTSAASSALSVTIDTGRRRRPRSPRGRMIPELPATASPATTRSSSPAPRRPTARCGSMTARRCSGLSPPTAAAPGALPPPP